MPSTVASDAVSFTSYLSAYLSAHHTPRDIHPERRNPLVVAHVVDHLETVAERPGTNGHLAAAAAPHPIRRSDGIIEGAHSTQGFVKCWDATHDIPRIQHEHAQICACTCDFRRLAPLSYHR